MSEQVTCKCRRWHLKSMDNGHAWWFSGQRDHFGNTFHCETCGDRLNADGTTQAMVPVETGEDEDWGLEYCANDQCWRYATSPVEFPVEFNPHTGERLNADGTVTRMVSLADAGAGALALLIRLIDVSHEVAAEDIPYKVTSPEQAVLAGLRDGYAHGRNRALSVMQGTICGMMQALRDRYGIVETETEEATDETA